MRRDDGVGPWLAAGLSERGRRTAMSARDGAAVATLLDGRVAGVVLDATRGAGAPGAVTALDLRHLVLRPDRSPASTHLLGLAEGIELLRALGALPLRLLFFGVEGADFGRGEGLTPRVETAAEALLPRLLRLQAG
jgi:hydrogenase maturation protease